MMNPVEKHQEACSLIRKQMRVVNMSGEWMNEPDRFETQFKGYDILLIRNIYMFHWCGFVGVKTTHPYFGKKGENLSAHGGINFTGECHGNICHNSPDKTWWFGFDCAHCEDVTPVTMLFGEMELLRLYPFRRYWTLNKVLKECKNLAKQLDKVTS